MQVDLAVAGSDVRVHVVNPGVIDTDLFHLPDNDESMADIEALPVEAIVQPVLDQLAAGTFEIYVPEWFTDIVAHKFPDTGAFLEGSHRLGQGQDLTPATWRRNSCAIGPAVDAKFRMRCDKSRCPSGQVGARPTSTTVEPGSLDPQAPPVIPGLRGTPTVVLVAVVLDRDPAVRVRGIDPSHERAPDRDLVLDRGLRQAVTSEHLAQHRLHLALGHRRANRSRHRGAGEVSRPRTSPAGETRQRGRHRPERDQSRVVRLRRAPSRSSPQDSLRRSRAA